MPHDALSFLVSRGALAYLSSTLIIPERFSGIHPYKHRVQGQNQLFGTISTPSSRQTLLRLQVGAACKQNSAKPDDLPRSLLPLRSSPCRTESRPISRGIRPANDGINGTNSKFVKHPPEEQESSQRSHRGVTKPANQLHTTRYTTP